MAEEKEGKKTLEVVIGFNYEDEDIEYIKSDFLKESFGFKDPIEYTAKLMQMALEKWIREKIGLFCPSCERQLEENWQFCPTCGWNSDNNND